MSQLHDCGVDDCMVQEHEDAEACLLFELCPFGLVLLVQVVQLVVDLDLLVLLALLVLSGLAVGIVCYHLIVVLLIVNLVLIVQKVQLVVVLLMLVALVVVLVVLLLSAYVPQEPHRLGIGAHHLLEQWPNAELHLDLETRMATQAIHWQVM